MAAYPFWFAARMEVMYSFEIETAEDLLAAAEETFRDYLQDGLSSRKAVASAMLCWHVSDWMYQESAALQARFSQIGLFHKHITSECRSLQVMQDIANGTKHREPKTPRAGIVKTEPRTGSFSPEFDRSFDRAELTIHLAGGVTTAFDIEFREALKYLRTLSANQG